MDRDLAHWLSLQHLTAADLEANRKGRLADVQARRVRADVSTRRRAVGIGMLFGALGGIGSIAIQAQDASSMLVAIPAVLVVTFVVFVLLMRLFLGGIEHEVSTGTVTALETTVGRVWRSPPYNGFVIKVDGRSHYGRGLRELGKALKTGDRVKLHLLPKTRTIVAVEPA